MEAELALARRLAVSRGTLLLTGGLSHLFSRAEGSGALLHDAAAEGYR